MGPYQPSMQIDHRLGRPLELDAIFARAVAAGNARGVAMPRTEMLYILLGAVSEGIGVCVAE
jgi:2-dehydropantoate 2-reductase